MNTAGDIPREKVVHAIECLEGLLDNVQGNSPALQALTEAIVVLNRMLAESAPDGFQPRNVPIRRDDQ